MDLDINMECMANIMESSELDRQIQKDNSRPVVVESTEKVSSQRNDNTNTCLSSTLGVA